MGTWGITRRFWLTGLAAGLCAPAQADDDLAPSQPLAVYVTGSVPGVADKDLASVFAGLLMAQHIEGWIFLAGGEPMAPDRLVWRISQLPETGGKAANHRSAHVDVRLYLDGKFLTTSFATVEIPVGANDPKLAALVAEISGPLFRYAFRRR